ncbi:Crp/Fnr family transcriptional regulator [Pedobacter gandavensis]|uniref:Crp/Fnr family transcriptional regulator n=1 Tax=Pedobacter gandavensis TaxID=2679963 RepID=UPI00292FE623|nr:Crp/Fnr family transcriptional regulator [Pedobacter gandavensis]
MQQSLLQHIRQYIPLNKLEEKIISESISILQVKKKTIIFEPGQSCKGNYFVGKGCLRLFFIDDKGVEQTTQFAIENWWISDYTSLALKKKSTFYLQAIEDSTIFLLETRTEELLFEQVPCLERYFRVMLQRAYGASQHLARYNHSLSKEAQYRHFVKSFPDFAERIPQYMLASYLGFTPEFLSKIRAKKVRTIS